MTELIENLLIFWSMILSSVGIESNSYNMVENETTN